MQEVETNVGGASAPTALVIEASGLKPLPQKLESRKVLREGKNAIREGEISLPESKIAFPEQLFQIRESKKAIPMQQISVPE